MGKIDRVKDILKVVFAIVICLGIAISVSFLDEEDAAEWWL